jgi:large subunit ribosomal protein L29
MARDTAELRSLADEALAHELDEAHQALFNLRFQAATGQLADVMQVGLTKRRIARIKTLLRERQILAIADAVAGAGTENEA